MLDADAVSDNHIDINETNLILPSRSLVDAARETDRNWCKGSQVFAVCGVPDGGSGCAADALPRNA